MGGRSRSSQSTTNHQTTNNYVNDGDFAGASNVSVDESDRSVSDSFNQDFELNNEENYDYSTEQDIDDSFNTDNSQHLELREAFNTSTSNRTEQNFDNSVETDISDAYNTDNSIEVSDGNFAHGDIVLSDSGAIDAAQAIAIAALDNAGASQRANAELQRQLANTTADVSVTAIEELRQNARDAFALSATSIGEVTDFSGDAISQFGDTTENLVDSLQSSVTTVAEQLNETTRLNFESQRGFVTDITDQLSDTTRLTLAGQQNLIANVTEQLTDTTRLNLEGQQELLAGVTTQLSNNSQLTLLGQQELFDSVTKQLTQTAQRNQASNNGLVAGLGEQSAENTRVIAELARSTNLAGQDIVAESSQRMTLYMAAAFGVGIVAIAFVMGRN
ncbi:hypothetical protein [Thalassotalea euphylliae]|uniref:Uncharacterized protein n=1 Tax=Thalassotalea euphylliae TaxID=1655234 RepID=A0A3E0U2U9_9GAMM|nr:hypothetical protein [Thalassotalea euphylliae]REL31079.1 hypothetical protein DXX94_10330 [Thalassotalea euphylliae]